MVSVKAVQLQPLSARPPSGDAREAPAGVQAPGARQEGRLVHTWVGAWLQRLGSELEPLGTRVGGDRHQPPGLPGRGEKFSECGHLALAGLARGLSSPRFKELFSLNATVLENQAEQADCMRTQLEPSREEAFSLNFPGLPQPITRLGLKTTEITLSPQQRPEARSHVLCH